VNTDHVRLLPPDSYAAVMHKSGRVKVLKSDIGLSSRIESRAKWLRRKCLPRLDDELGVSFPLVVVHPVLWRFSLQGAEGTAHGGVKPFLTAAGNVIAVHLSAASLLAYPDRLVDGILAHEFLHYVWITGQIASGQTDLCADNYSGDFAQYVARDRLDAADPTEWLTERLKQATSTVEQGPDDHAARWMVKHWAQAGAPVEMLEVGFSAEGEYLLDATIVDRLRGDTQ
jgi:hypothetical protein